MLLPSMLKITNKLNTIENKIEYRHAKIYFTYGISVMNKSQQDALQILMIILRNP